MLRIFTAMLIVGSGAAASAQDYVNGYTYVAPRYYLTPPVVTYPSVDVFPPYYLAQPVEVRPPYWVPQPLPVASYPVPAPSVVSYPIVPAPTYFRERVKYSPREIEYTIRGPYGQREKVEIEFNRYGGVKEVEYRRR